MVQPPPHHVVFVPVTNVTVPEPAHRVLLQEFIVATLVISPVESPVVLRVTVNDPDIPGATLPRFRVMSPVSIMEGTRELVRYVVLLGN